MYEANIHFFSSRNPFIPTEISSRTLSIFAARPVFNQFFTTSISRGYLTSTRKEASVPRGCH